MQSNALLGQEPITLNYGVTLPTAYNQGSFSFKPDILSIPGSGVALEITAHVVRMDEANPSMPPAFSSLPMQPIPAVELQSQTQTQETKKINIKRKREPSHNATQKKTKNSSKKQQKVHQLVWLDDVKEFKSYVEKAAGEINLQGNGNVDLISHLIKMKIEVEAKESCLFKEFSDSEYHLGILKSEVIDINLLVVCCQVLPHVISFELMDYDIYEDNVDKSRIVAFLFKEKNYDVTIYNKSKNTNTIIEFFEGLLRLNKANKLHPKSKPEAVAMESDLKMESMHSAPNASLSAPKKKRNMAKSNKKSSDQEVVSMALEKKPRPKLRSKPQNQGLALTVPKPKKGFYSTESFSEKINLLLSLPFSQRIKNFFGTERSTHVKLEWKESNNNIPLKIYYSANITFKGGEKDRILNETTSWLYGDKFIQALAQKHGELKFCELEVYYHKESIITAWFAVPVSGGNPVFSELKDVKQSEGPQGTLSGSSTNKIYRRLVDLFQPLETDFVDESKLYDKKTEAYRIPLRVGLERPIGDEHITFYTRALPDLCVELKQGQVETIYYGVLNQDEHKLASAKRDLKNTKLLDLYNLFEIRWNKELPDILLKEAKELTDILRIHPQFLSHNKNNLLMQDKIQKQLDIIANLDDSTEDDKALRANYRRFTRYQFEQHKARELRRLYNTYIMGFAELNASIDPKMTLGTLYQKIAEASRKSTDRSAPGFQDLIMINRIIYDGVHLGNKFDDDGYRKKYSGPLAQFAENIYNVLWGGYIYTFRYPPKSSERKAESQSSSNKDAVPMESASIAVSSQTQQNSQNAEPMMLTLPPLVSQPQQCANLAMASNLKTRDEEMQQAPEVQPESEHSGLQANFGSGFTV